MGSVSVLYSANKTFNGRSDDRLSGSWGWQFKQVTITASLETSLCNRGTNRSEEHTSELQSLMRISYAVFCLKKKKNTKTNNKKYKTYQIRHSEIQKT